MRNHPFGRSLQPSVQRSLGTRYLHNRWMRSALGLGSLGLLLVAACGSPDPESLLPAEEVGTLQAELSGPAPQLTSISPNIGPADGGTTLTLTGKNFRPGTSVSIGGIKVSSYAVQVVSSTVMIVTLPAKPGAFGRVPVVVTRPEGKSVTRSDLFYYYSDKLQLDDASRFGHGVIGSRAVTADINGDGKLDQVILGTPSWGSSDNVLAVALGTGTGLLQEPKLTTLPEGSMSDLAVADLNGDKKADVTVAVYDGDTKSVLVLLGNGDGTFAAPQFPPSIAGVTRIFAQDLNGDGRVDLLGVGVDPILWSSTAAVYQSWFGKGDGTFEAAVGLTLSPAEVSEVLFDDWTGDGVPDLLTVNRGLSALRVFPGKGDGTFGAVITAGAISGVSYSPKVKAGDYNGDGKRDLLISRYSGIPALYLAKGDGTFAGPQDVADDQVSNDFTVGDINGDGKLDLLSTTSSASAYYLGKGDGTFGLRQSFSSRSFAGPVLADLNVDKKAELVGSRSLTVLVNNGSGYLDPASMPTGTKPSAVRLADVNADGKSDLIVTNYDKGTVRVALGEGNGRFGALATFTAGLGANGVAVGDVSGDSKVDLVVSNFDASSVSVLLGNGDGTFAAPRSLAVGNSPSGVVLADVNADGRLDIATSNYDSDSATVLLNSGAGSFGAAKHYPVQKFPTAIASGDLNGDGKADLVVTNSESGSVSVLLAITTGMGVARNVAVGKNPLAVTVADYNGDSKLDVAVASSDDSSVAVLLNSGTGTLTATTPLAVCSFPSALAAADMDGDGRSDLVVSCDGGTDIKYWMGFGDGAFFPSSTSEYLSSNSSMALADLNGDTKMDLVYVQDALELATSRLNRTP